VTVARAARRSIHAIATPNPPINSNPEVDVGDGTTGMGGTVRVGDGVGVLVGVGVGVLVGVRVGVLVGVAVGVGVLVGVAVGVLVGVLVGVGVGVLVGVDVGVLVGVRVGVLVGVWVGVLVGVGVGVLVGVAVGVLVGVLVGVCVGVLVGVDVGVFVGVGVGVFVGVGVGVFVGVGVGVFVGVGVGVGVGCWTVVRPDPVPVPVTPFTAAVPETRPSWSVCIPGSGSESLVGSFSTSTKKSIVHASRPLAVPGGCRTTEALGMNSNSPVVGSTGPSVNVIPAQAVPVLPVAGPLARKTPGSSKPEGHGVESVPHEGVWRMADSVTVPPFSGDVEVLVAVRLTCRFVSPTVTIGG